MFASLRTAQDTPLGKRIPHRVAYELMGRITAGTYPRGGWLPTEQKLLSEFSVSRTVLRQALIILECLGLIESHHGAGNQVIGGNPARASDISASVDLAALLEACRVFEIQTASMAAALDPQDAVSPCWPTLSPRDWPTAEYCRHFHVALAQATGNPAIVASIRNLWDFAVDRPETRNALNAALSESGGQIRRLQQQVKDALSRGAPADIRLAIDALFERYCVAALEMESRQRMMHIARENQDRRGRWSRRLGAAAPPNEGS